LEPEGSLPHSQEPATCLYPEPAQSSPCPCPTSWRSILILSSHLCLGLPSGLLPSGLPTKILNEPVLSPYVLHALPISFFFYFITHIIFGEEYRSLSCLLSSLLHLPVTSSLVGSNIHLSTLFSNTLRLCSSINVSVQVLHPYKATGKIIVPYILIFIFLYSKLEDKIFCTKW
jgi:hypothetical protein